MNKLRREKLIIFIALTLLVSGPYYALQHYQFFPMRRMPVTAFDQLIPFDARAVWLYLSLYLLLPIPLLLVTDLVRLRRMALGFGLIAVISHLVFLFWPNEILHWRPDPAGTNFLFAAVLSVDGTTNACPSLHASLATYCVLCCDRLLRKKKASPATEDGRDGSANCQFALLPAKAAGRKQRKLTVCATAAGRPGAFQAPNNLSEEKVPGWIRAGLWLWVGIILYATLATRQHVVIDLIAGAALALAVYLGLSRLLPSGGGLYMKQISEDALSDPSPALLATTKARDEVSRGLEAEIAQLRHFDLRKRLREIAFFVLLWLLGMAVALTGWRSQAPAVHYPALALGILISAVAINAFVLLMHEGMHHTLFAGARWNRAASVAFGYAFLMSFTAYQVMHTRHHNYLGDPRDPDDYHNYTRRPLLVWCLHFMRLTVGPELYIFLIPALALKHGTVTDRRRILCEYPLMILVYALILTVVPPDVLLVAWLIPLLVVGSMVAIRGFTQHGITDAADPFIASRTILPHPVVAFCLLNENYHLEHHLFPEIPSYHLPALHRLVWLRLPYAVTGRSYLGFIVRFLRATRRMDETPIGLEKLKRSESAAPQFRETSTV